MAPTKFSDIMNDLKGKNPEQYAEIMAKVQINQELLERYKNATNIPTFESPVEYENWLNNTPEGRKYSKTVQKLEKETEKVYKQRPHGGSRKGAGRKKIHTQARKKVTKNLSLETVNILKEFSKTHNITEDEIIETLIKKGCQEKPEMFFNLGMS